MRECFSGRSKMILATELLEIHGKYTRDKGEMGSNSKV